MKRILSCFLAVWMAALLAACASQKPKETTAETTTPADTTEAATAAGAETSFTTEDVTFTRDNQKIAGELLLPQSDAPMPLVILCHGFGGNRFNVSDYAEAFAKNGIAAYIFDFIGGGNSIKSDGKTTEMSVLTEAADLNVILDALQADARFDKNKIFLFGESQGGFVATYVACKRPKEVAGLAVLYPAYVIHDTVKENVPDADHIPETATMMGTDIGGIYARDALSFDIYDMMKDYDKKVLIIHGMSDSIVPLTYSERAIKTFPSAELIKIEGAEHGFQGKDKTDAAQKSLAYVQTMIQ